MKKIENYELAIGQNDYKVDLIVSNDLKVNKIIAKENVNEEECSCKKGEEVKLDKEEIKFISENIKEEFENNDLPNVKEEMSLEEKLARVKEINSLLKGLQEERKQLLQELQEAKSEKKETKVEPKAATSKSIDELVKEAIDTKQDSGKVVDTAMKGLKKADIMAMLQKSGFSYSNSKSKSELINNIKSMVGKRVGFEIINEQFKKNNSPER